MTAHGRRRPGGATSFTFDYDPGLIAALKANIPAPSRSYDPATKTWTVRPPAHHLAERLVREFFPDLTITNDSYDAVRPIPLRPHDAAYAELSLLPTAPPELVDAAYRVLSRSAHPDVGGSNDRQRELNAAFELLRQRRVVAS